MSVWGAAGLCRRLDTAHVVDEIARRFQVEIGSSLGLQRDCGVEDMCESMRMKDQEW